VLTLCLLLWLVCVVCVSSGRSAEDCPLYCAHSQTQLALLQRGAPLLKLRLSLSLRSLDKAAIFHSPPLCVCAPLHASHSWFYFPVGRRMVVMEWACSFLISFLTKLLHEGGFGEWSTWCHPRFLLHGVSYIHIHHCNRNVMSGNMSQTAKHTSVSLHISIECLACIGLNFCGSFSLKKANTLWLPLQFKHRRESTNKLP